MSRSLRIKHCSRCQQIASVLYRVQYDESGAWIFVCERCWSSLSQDNPHYVYGGTRRKLKKNLRAGWQQLALNIRNRENPAHLRS